MRKSFTLITVLTGCLILTVILSTGKAWADEPRGEKGEREERKTIGLTFSLDYTSNYLWRGTKYYGGDGAIFPSVTYTIPKVGITLYFGAELSQSWMFNGFKKVDNKYYLTGDIYSGASIAKKEGKYNHLAYSGHSLDFGGSWAYTIKEKFTIGAMAYFYYLYNTRDSFEYGQPRLSNGLLTLWTPVNWDILSTAVWFGFDFVPWINPKLYVYHDYYTGRNVSGNYYVNLDLSHPFKLTDHFSVTVGISGAYYVRRITENTYYYFDTSGNWYRSRTPLKKGISNINPRVGISFTKGGLTFRAGFKWVIIPAKSFYKGEENHRYAANLGVSYNL